MRNSILVIFSFLFSLSVEAQKGEWITGGNISFSILNQDFDNNVVQFNSGTRGIYFGIAPEIAWSFAKTWQLGLGIPYGYSHTKRKLNNGTYSYESHSLGAEIILRKFFPVTNFFSPFLDLNGFYRGNWGDGTFVGESTIYGTNLALGASFGIASRFKFFFSYDMLFYNFQDNDGDSFWTTYGFSAFPSGGLNFGLYYVIRPSPN